MKLEDLPKSFQFIVTAFEEWFACLRDPAQTSRFLLERQPGSAAPVKSAIRLWLTAVILCAILQSPIYYLYGIELSSLVIHVFYTLSLLLILVTTNVSSWVGIRIFKIPLTGTVIFVANTVIASALAPLLTVATYYWTFESWETLSQIRSGGLDLRSVIRSQVQPQEGPGYAAMFALPLSWISWFLAPTIFVRYVSADFNISKDRLMDAVCFGLVTVGAIGAALELLGMLGLSVILR